MTKPQVIDQVTAITQELAEVLEPYPFPEGMLATLVLLSHMFSAIRRLDPPAAVLPEVDKLSDDIKGLTQALARVLYTEEPPMTNGKHQ